MTLMRFCFRALLATGLLMLLVNPGRTDAQSLYGADFRLGQVSIFQIDPATGTMTPVVATGATSFAGGISAFDPLENRFFFISSSNLYTVDLDSGVVSHVTLGGLSPQLQFDARNGVLYGIDFSAGHITVFSINPSTGAMLPVVNTDATSMVGGVTAFDPAGQRFFFIGSNLLYTADVATGTFSTTSLGGAFPQLQYDTGSRTLYGVDFAGGQVSIFVVNPVTGTMTPVAATGATSIAGGISAFDPAMKRFFFVGNSQLYVVNVATGQVTTASLAGANPLLQFDATHAVPVPGLSLSAKLLLGFVLACAGLVALRGKVG